MFDRIPVGNEDRIRLRTLILIRWLAIAGQTIAVIVVSAGLGFNLPIGFCLVAISVSAWLNVFLLIRYPSTKLMSDREAGLYLAYDILQLAALFYLTGGIENPFMLLFLVPVTISATILSLFNTVMLGLLTFGVVTLLSIFHMPLPWTQGDGPALPGLYLVGMWLALILGTAFLATYAWRVAAESRKMSDALTATQMALAREQKMSALGGLAASAAHELGTPLGTINLVADELSHEIDNPDLQDDLNLLITQAQRCREILGRLSERPADDDAHYHNVPFEGVVEEAANPHKERDVEVRVKINVLGDRDHPSEESRGTLNQPIIMRQPEMVHGLGNLIENAVDFAKSEVELDLSWTEKKLILTMTDDGAGFALEVLDRLGEPYVSTRRTASGSLVDESAADKGSGSASLADLIRAKDAEDDEVFEGDRTLLVCDDDKPWRERLGRAMERRQFDVVLAGSIAEGMDAINLDPPAYAVVDLRLEDGNGLELIRALHEKRPESRIVMLTGYGNIPTAVAAVKAGAIDYLAKPADADDVEAALMVTGDELPAPPENPMSADRAAKYAPPDPAADSGQAELDDHAALLSAVKADLMAPLDTLIDACAASVQSGGKILFFGNGGSASDAQHLATELSIRYAQDRAPIAGLALNTDTSAITAAGNDFGYEAIFARQIEALGNKGDVAIGISTSGTSPNVISGLEQARGQGLVTVGFGGKGGGKLPDVCDHILIVPSDTTARIQEMHILLGHMLCAGLESRLGLV
ncbi:regB [Symbiodinium microadriaticum]|nr:regB [Symbiodinium microadriaticum]